MDKIYLNELFNEQAKTLKIYVAKETISDPYEKNVELTELNPFPIRAIITDLTTAQANYKLYGIEVNKAKDILTHKRYRSLIEISSKIKVEGDDSDFYGWKDNAGRNIQIREIGNFIRLYIYSK